MATTKTARGFATFMEGITKVFAPEAFNQARKGSGGGGRTKRQGQRKRAAAIRAEFERLAQRTERENSNKTLIIAGLGGLAVVGVGVAIAASGKK